MRGRRSVPKICISLSLAAAVSVAYSQPTRFGEVIISRGEVAGQRYVTGQAEFGPLAPLPDATPLGECSVSRGVLQSREVDAEAYGAEIGEQGQAALISAGERLTLEDDGQVLMTLEARDAGYRSEGGANELLRRLGAVAGPLPAHTLLKVPGQAGVYGFPAFSMALPNAPEFVWQTPDTVPLDAVLHWQGASLDAEARVKVLLKQGEGLDAQNVICNVPDTGMFAFPIELGRQLADLPNAEPLKVVGAFRSITRTARQDDAELRVVLEEGGLR